MKISQKLHQNVESAFLGKLYPYKDGLVNSSSLDRLYWMPKIRQGSGSNLPNLPNLIACLMLRVYTIPVLTKQTPPQRPPLHLPRRPAQQSSRT